MCISRMRRFPNEKLHPLDTPQEALQLLRLMGAHKVKDLIYRDRRPHMLADAVTFELPTPEVTLIKCTAHFCCFLRLHQYIITFEC